MKKDIRIVRSIEIGTSPASAWEILYDRFGEAFLYNPNLTGSHFTRTEKGEIGSERECRFDKRTYVRESIIKADRYSNFTIKMIVGNIFMVKNILVDVRLKQLHGGNTMVFSEAIIETKPLFIRYFVKGIFKTKMDKMLIGLKYFLETGEPVTNKSFDEIYSEYSAMPPGGLWEHL